MSEALQAPATSAAPAQQSAPTLSEQIEELQRDHRQRPITYARMIEGGRLTEAEAARRIARLKAAIGSLQALRRQQNGMAP
jgi:hypothetical protein